jgi:TPR repeat protein
MFAATRKAAIYGTVIATFLSVFATSEAHAQIGESQANSVATSPKQRQAIDLVQAGLKYEHAEGVVKDFPKAHDSYCLAARLDFPEAFLRLGWMYANGRGVPRSDSMASSLFKRAAALGDEMGARLAEMIRGDREEFPICLISKAPINVAQQTAIENKAIRDCLRFQKRFRFPSLLLPTKLNSQLLSLNCRRTSSSTLGL